MALTRNRLIANLAKASDSAASSSFLAKGATEANYRNIAYSDITSKPTMLDSAGITSIVDSAYIQARQTSGISSGLDSAGITSLIDSNYVVARAASGSSGYGRYNYTATAGQTVFQDSDNSGAILSYTSGGIMVFYNGVMLKNTADWEGTDGSSVTLVEAAAAGANVSIHKWRVAGGASGGSAGIAWGGDRGLFIGGRQSGYYNNVDYVDITSAANATDFGDLDQAKGYCASLSDGSRILYAGGNAGSGILTYIGYFTSSTPSNATSFGTLGASLMSNQGFSDGTYGVFGESYSAPQNLQYVTVQTTSNSSVFGQLTQSRERAGACSNSTYGYICGGGTTNVIDYVTIASPSNATDFGDLIVNSLWVNAASNTSYGVIHTGNNSNSLEYISMGGTSGNATDFGDLNLTAYGIAASSNDTTAVFGSGFSSTWVNTIDYVTIDSPSNATDFGDLTLARYGSSSASGSPS